MPLQCTLAIFSGCAAGVVVVAAGAGAATAGFAASFTSGLSEDGDPSLALVHAAANSVAEVSAMFDVGRDDVLERMPMILMRFTNGTMAFANGNQVTPLPLNDIVIHGSTGRIDGRGITRPLKEGDMRVVTASGETTTHYSSHDCYIRTVAAYSRAILDGRDPNPSGLDGLRSVQLNDAIKTSAREGRVVEVAS